MEINLKGVGEDRRDGDVNSEKDADDLEVTLRAELVELKRDGKHKVEHDQVVKGHGVEICISVEEIFDIAIGIDDRRHQDHIERERSEAGECGCVRDVTELPVVKRVKGQEVKEKAAVVEGEGVHIV